MGSRLKTRCSGPLLDSTVIFPLLEHFEHPNKLPTLKSVIGLLRYLTEEKHSKEAAILEVAKRIFCKYYHDTVCCLSVRGIEKRLEKLWGKFKEGNKRVNAGRTSGEAVEAYKKLVKDANSLYDVAVTDSAERVAVETKWGIKMTKNEFDYYEDMKNERKMECDRGSTLYGILPCYVDRD